ncbi:hypothetical protein C8R46DRAFT_1027829 [Mycena filopes]|nr:hypothetical protein C8R46DRAFT_1027829 [Mycena filopes]
MHEGYDSEDDPGEGALDSEMEPVESEDEGGEVYFANPKRTTSTRGRENVNAVERTVPIVLDGVYPPRREKPQEKPASENTAPVEAPRSSAVPVPLASSKLTAEKVREILADVQPIDARQVRVLPSPKQGKTQENPGTPVELDRRKLTPSRPEELVKAEPKITGRQSDIQSSVHLPAIVKRLLDLEIPLTVREVLVASKEIRNEIQDVIHLKNVILGHDSPLIANWAWPRSEGVLIRVEMEIGGRRVVAIVDTALLLRLPGFHRGSSNAGRLVLSLEDLRCYRFLDNGSIALVESLGHLLSLFAFHSDGYLQHNEGSNGHGNGPLVALPL